jgi:hypothetical protein
VSWQRKSTEFASRASDVAFNGRGEILTFLGGSPRGDSGNDRKSSFSTISLRHPWTGKPIFIRDRDRDSRRDS